MPAIELALAPENGQVHLWYNAFAADDLEYQARSGIHAGKAVTVVELPKTSSQQIDTPTFLKDIEIHNDVKRMMIHDYQIEISAYWDSRERYLRKEKVNAPETPFQINFCKAVERDICRTKLRIFKTQEEIELATHLGEYAKNNGLVVFYSKD